jgi:hypothetical protein
MLVLVLVLRLDVLMLAGRSQVWYTQGLMSVLVLALTLMLELVVAPVLALV